MNGGREKLTITGNYSAPFGGPRTSKQVRKLADLMSRKRPESSMAVLLTDGGPLG